MHKTDRNDKIEHLLTVIHRAKSRYFQLTNQRPDTVTLHYEDVDMLRRYNLDYCAPENYQVQGLKVLRSSDIKPGYCLVGEIQ
ncbi:hypothetical protein [Flagellimonas sp.]|uniref:hypothetical protein n=1 Tax=Flagellimonas sp. TaxID=2058762 RepID=UPI003BAC21BA